MNQKNSEPKQDNHSHQNDTVNVSNHLHDNEESSDIYDSQNTRNHDGHLEQATILRDTKGYQRTLLFSFIIITGYMFI